MNNTTDLIASLSADARPTKKMGSPAYWIVRLASILAIYATGCQLYLGLRPDLIAQFTRPLFVVEILSLSLLLMSSAIASVLAMYPDVYQKTQLIKLPYAIFSMLVVLIGFQLWMPHDARMIIPEVGAHGMKCALCIASLALVPSALLFALLRKGASVHPFQAGTFAVLASSAIGCLTLRLSEANDSVIHLAQWHYVPTFFFAALGAILGKWLLRW